MRIELANRSLSLSPGSPGTVDVDVFNTDDTIDGVTGRIVGLDAAWVVSTPAQLALFPETSGRLQLRVTLPPEFPAGTHVLTVEITSSVDPTKTAFADLELTVLPLTQATLLLVPTALTAKRNGRFTLMCENTGNTPVALSFSATDPERALRYEFEPDVLEVAPGQSENGGMLVHGRRHLFGGDQNRPITVLGENVELQLAAHGTFTQKPVFARGALTMLALAAIVALWAGALLLGLSKVLSHDPLAKSAPASFFAGVPGGIDGKGNATAPNGAVSKQGAASKDLGGTISGTVRAVSTEAGVGRITVEAIRESKAGPVLVSSAASQEDGTYAVSGLLPGQYKLRFSSSGFTDVWYPTATAIAGATPVGVTAVNQTKGIDSVIAGLPGSISGQVDTGVSPAPIPVSVAIRPIVANVPGALLPTTATNSTQQFAISSLATPGSYELTFAATGYQPTTVVQQLRGGEALVTNTVRLTAADGSISGTVTDGVNPLGGVVVTAIAGDKSVTSATPTSGAVGRFTIAALASPQTYLLTFSKDGFGAQTIAVDLGPGEDRANVDVSLTGGTGSISGRALDENGVGVGDVSVTVTGGTTSLTTRTLTAGAQGTYFMSGLPTPGDYTVTFTAPGRATQTVPVSLGSSGLATSVDATVSSTLATLQGNVISNVSHTGLSGATVTVTDGTNIRTTTSSNAPTQGFFQVDGLAPGTYTVTISATGFKQRTTLVTLTAGQTFVLNQSSPQDATLDPA
jgi:hypothetical protein